MRKLFYISVTLCLLAAVVGCGRGVDRNVYYPYGGLINASTPSSTEKMVK